MCSSDLVMSYEKEYRVIDQLLEGTTRPTSPFTAKTGASMLDTLFQRAPHIPLWILSLENEVVTLEELEAKMTKLGRQTKAIAIKYQHLPAVSTEEKKRENEEFLVVGWDPQAALQMKASVEKIEVLEPVIEAELGDVTASVQVHSDHLGPEDTAAQRFARERPHEGDARLSQKRPPHLASRSSAETKAGFNQPDAVFVERALGGDGELRRTSMDGHYTPSSLNGPMSRRSDEPES